MYRRGVLLAHADAFTITGISVGFFLFFCLLLAPHAYDRWGTAVRRTIEKSRRPKPQTQTTMEQPVETNKAWPSRPDEQPGSETDSRSWKGRQ